MARSVYELRSTKTVKDYIDNKISMLDNSLPVEYSKIESWQDAEEFAYKLKPRVIRVHIIWDNQVSEMPLSEVLDKMRETGAAMVVKAEQV